MKNYANTFEFWSSIRKSRDQGKSPSIEVITIITMRIKFDHEESKWHQGGKQVFNPLGEAIVNLW